MNNLIDVPIASVTALTPERAVLVMRAILRSECGYAKLSPTVLTISSRLTITDGGIDAEVNIPPGHTIPADCMFQPGLTGFQIKSTKLALETKHQVCLHGYLSAVQSNDPKLYTF